MKTATIDVYAPWGTSGVSAARICYGRRVLHHIEPQKRSARETMADAMAWAAREGFTHWRRLDGAGGVRSMAPDFPRLERGDRIEIPRPVKGRPSYTWVQGWIVRYSPDRVSLPMRYSEARNLLQQVKEGKA